MAQYLLQTILFQLIFLLAYELLLKKETFFTYNRWYLLLTPFISLLLPLLKLESLATVVPTDTMVLLPEVFIGNASTPEATNQAVATATASNGTNLWWLLYAAGAFISLLLFLLKYRMILKLSRNRIISEDKTYKIIEVPDSSVAFTFFNTIYLGDKLEPAEKKQILSHEVVHVLQKHSFDLVVFEILRILLWFNPLVYIYQSRIATLHEYIADAKAVKSVEKSTYYQQLLNTAFSTKQISFINQFFNHSLIKKRILMLQKAQSKTIAKVKYLVLVPLMLLMLTVVACSEDAGQGGDSENGLSQYEYTLKQGEEMSPEKKAIHTKYEDFLINNPDYVSWATIDHEAGEITYTVHPKEEKFPGGFYETQVNTAKGAYTSYMNFRIPNSEAYNKGLEAGKIDIVEIEEYNSQDITYVPFALIDEVPVFPGCEGENSNAERKKCLTEKIASHINANFNTNLGKGLNLKGTNRINVQFAITKEGNIEIHGARGPAPELEEEARRVLSDLPEMIPGKQRGEEVAVLYSMPIVFMVVE